MVLGPESDSRKGYTDNVVDLMVGKLNRLSAETRNALQKLACLGNKAGFTMLRIVYQNSEEEMHGQLWEAVRAGLIFRSENSYKFLHDRVQEAAYSLIPEESRAEAHLRIGMLLAAQALRRSWRRRSSKSSISSTAARISSRQLRSLSGSQS